MFKIGDTVIIKQLTEEQQNHILYAPDKMAKYQGQKGRIIEHENEYLIHFSDWKEYWWLEEWIEPETEYNAF